MKTTAAAICLSVLLLGACQSAQRDRWGWSPSSPLAEDAEPVDIGLLPGYEARLVVGGLNNPSSVSFRPRSHTLTVCDSGNGRVLLVENGAAHEYVTHFTTEYWKVDAETGEKRFELGPLSAVWVNEDVLAVTDAGLPDGHEVVRFFRSGGAPATGAPTNSVPPTTGLPGDNGEGNLTGMAVADGGRTLYVCGQGSDAATWVLRCDVTDRRLEPFASLDPHAIGVNSPMQCIAHGDDGVLVLYSGAGGKDDGLIALWNQHGDLQKTWTLPGLTDPMGMAAIPGTHGELVVVDNNWALKTVKAGRLARVKLGMGGGAAEVDVIANDLRGPVSCAFGPDGRLYVAELGAHFDSGEGRVIAVWGLDVPQDRMQTHPNY